MSKRPKSSAIFDGKPLFSSGQPKFSWRRVIKLFVILGISSGISFLIGFHLDIQNKVAVSRVLLQEELRETQASITMEFYAQHISGLVRAYVRMGGEFMPTREELLRLQKGSNVLINPYDPRQRVQIIDVDYEGQPVYTVDSDQLYNKVGYYTDSGIAVKVFLWDRQGVVIYKATLTLSGINMLFIPPQWFTPEGNDSYITPEEFQNRSQVKQGGV